MIPYHHECAQVQRPGLYSRNLGWMLCVQSALCRDLWLMDAMSQQKRCLQDLFWPKKFTFQWLSPMPWYLTLWKLRHMDTFFPSNEILPEHSQCIRICGTKSLDRFEVLGRNAWNCSHAGSRKLVHENTCQRWFYARQALYIYHEITYHCNCIFNYNKIHIQ